MTLHLNRKNINNIFILGSRGYKKGYGGWETFVDKLIENWSEESNFFVFDITSKKKDDKQIIEKNGVLCPQVYVSRLGALTMFVFAIKSFFRAIKLIKKNKIENVNMLVLGSRAGHLYNLSKNRLAKLNINLIFNPDGLEWKRSRWNWFIKIYLKLSEKNMIKASSHIICDSKEILRYIQDEYNVSSDKSYYIAYGSINYDDIQLSQNDIYEFNNLALTHDFSSNEYYLIVARFVSENNIDLIIKGFSKSNTRKKLLIITNIDKGKYYKYLSSETPIFKDDRIKMIGPIYNSNLLSMFRINAYAYIHGHSVGGTNPSLLESLSLTKINIVYDVPFNKEVIKNFGFVFKDYIELSEVINKADLLSDQEITDLYIGSKENVNSNYNWKKIVEGYYSLLK